MLMTKSGQRCTISSTPFCCFPPTCNLLFPCKCKNRLPHTLSSVHLVLLLNLSLHYTPYRSICLSKSSTLHGLNDSSCQVLGHFLFQYTHQRLGTHSEIYTYHLLYSILKEHKGYLFKTYLD